MKKMWKHLLLSLSLVLLLTSCNHKTNYFVSGKFRSTDTDIIYYFEVEEISYENYILASGINVIKDLVLKENNYFALNFYKYIDDNQEIIDFINLKDQDPNVDAQPISYIDDNGITLTPYYMGYGTSISDYYCVTYETEHIYFERIE